MQQRLILIVALAALLCPSFSRPGQAGEAVVDSAAALRAALSRASDGDRIKLAPGDYGAMRLRNMSFGRTVTLSPADGAHTARFESLEISGVRNLRLEGIRVEATGGRAAVRITQSRNVAIADADIGGPADRSPPVDAVKFGVEIRDESSDIMIADSYVHDVLNGIAHFGTAGFTLTGNRVDHIGSDAFKFAGVDGGLIQDNTGPTHFYPAEDTHADFMQFQGPPSRNLEITGNVLLLQNRFDMQGIFFGGKGVHSNLAIQQNIIYTRMANGISVRNGSDVAIRHNTLINALSTDRPMTRISAAPGSVVERNIDTRKKGRMLGDNIAMQYLNPEDRFYYADLFTGLLARQGIAIDDIRPVPGSPAESYGAHARLMELQGRN